MLGLEDLRPQTESEQIHMRGLAASTLVSQPFWKELLQMMHETVNSRLLDIEKSTYAPDSAKANLVDRYILTKELVSRIERFPQGAIEAARESGE